MSKKSIHNILELSNELRWQIGDDFHDNLAEGIYADASEIVGKAVKTPNKKQTQTLDAKIDQIITSKIWGFPLMFLILGLVLWLTIIGANYPSGLLASLLLDTYSSLIKKWRIKYGDAMVARRVFN
jgi:ferrous iron transport protein B